MDNVNVIIIPDWIAVFVIFDVFVSIFVSFRHTRAHRELIKQGKLQHEPESK